MEPTARTAMAHEQDPRCTQCQSPRAPRASPAGRYRLTRATRLERLRAGFHSCVVRCRREARFALVGHRSLPSS
eukprot:5914288-Prymnesium_polylepis.2